ncbi:iron ABC transporter substrate-binding protein, partial [Neisseria gonorrhoeae]
MFCRIGNFAFCGVVSAGCLLNNKHSYSYAKEPHTVKPR